MEERENQSVYHEGKLMKKCKRKTWKVYWVLLKKQRLYFFVKENAYDLPETVSYAGSIALTADTKCFVKERAPGMQGRSRQEYFKFKLMTKNGVYLLKTETELERETWLERLGLSVALVHPLQNSGLSHNIGILNESLLTPLCQATVTGALHNSSHYEGDRTQSVELRSNATGNFCYGSLQEEDESNICRTENEIAQEGLKPLSKRLANGFRKNVRSRSFKKQGYRKQL